MKLNQVPYGQIESLRLRWTSASGALPNAVAPGAEALLQFSEREAQAMLRVGGDVLGVQGDGRKHEVLLADLCTRHFPRIAWVVDAGAQVLTLQVHTFLHALTLPPIELGVDEKVLEALERIDRKLAYPERALQWLGEQFLLDGEDGRRGFVTAESKAGTFAFFGRTARAFVRRVKRPDATEGLLVDRVARGRGQGGEQLALVSGDVRFVDATLAGKLRADAAAQISSLVTAGSSFLDLWSRYGAMENEVALRRARKARWLTYDHVESLPDSRYRFSLANDCSLEDADQFTQALTEEQGLGVEAVGKIPEVLTREMSWAEYEAQPRPKDAPSPATFKGRVELNRRDRTVTLVQRRSDEGTPPDAGALVVSLHGDKTRLKRRAEAESAIREARCPMPQLGLLLEERPVETPRRGNIAPVTPNVRRKVFGGRSPTPAQEKALWVALNTPDIALIQGPPGTGKTTVIVALVERLQEVWDTQDGVQGRLLLSGFQHDAVENAIQRMSVNGLPPIKFGGRSDSAEDADHVDVTIDRWCSERSAEIRKNLPPRPASAQQKELSELVQAYLLAPGTLEHTASLLHRVASRIQGTVPASLVDRVVALGREFTERARTARGGDPDHHRLVRSARALRCEERSFADDGPRNADRLAREFARSGRRDERAQKLLECASRWSSPGAPPFLDELRALRRRLLLDLLPPDRTEDTIPRVRTDVLELLSEVRDHLEQCQNTSRDAANEATWKFLAALEGEPEAVKRAVISYTSVFAATCQQSARQELATLKGSEGYDTVVVDEAARAMPLDLFIPMARAKRRIVLVGDHRQLPHILDKELERELEEALSTGKSEADRTSEMLNESLFARLFKDLKKRDDFPRVVTLDEQYRMHPLLGQFVSDQFYKPYAEAFRSPRPASDFVHSLPGHSGPASWLSVPRRLGPEREGQSKSRPVEAQAIVAELKRLMDSREGRELTFGVISFYKQQVTAIEDALVDAGIVSRTDDATEIVAPYRELQLPNGRVAERLRFGTVDAFQGMEFDVVFLSMVRSNPRGVFGHVTSPNRLCVAMSRQKRLLVVAGDDGMLHAPNAPSGISPLVEFHKLSEVHDAARI
ncbi:DEAD/DEAH box helicase [Azospirillum sp. ST 5-10]|uniref:DEAD/DEAH box helicase n=1 Tax=unclassified Azospirillum TaxID=2630922 RepID=UPI003F4A4EB8